MNEPRCATLSIEFFVPGPPVPYPRMTRYSLGTRRVQRSMAWRNEVGWLAKAAGAVLWDGPVGVTIDLYTRDRMVRRYDGSNVLKAVEDALQGICYANDKQVTVGAFHIYTADPVLGREIGTWVWVGSLT